MKLAAAVFIAMSGVLFAQTNTNDPTDTPTVRALTALLELRERANNGKWITSQAKNVNKARFVLFLKSPKALLEAKSLYERPNYGGNAFEAIRHTIWVRVAEGKPIQ
jgi:hypothetical protein